MSCAPTTAKPAETVTLTEMQILDIMVFEMCLSHEDVEQFWYLAKLETSKS